MGEETTADRLFDALTDVHRRRLLFALIDHNPQDVSELPDVPWTLSESEAVLTSKHHVHLPKLADYGLIEWERDEQIVTKGPRFDEIEPILQLLDDHRDELPVRMV
ncbi:DUF7344 domain-containing protein [Halopiger xanaduensis]|uniref:DUF7344 domain-containing protein n=1 Tax=Halopiger xanaduensis (strain DSM 18323 / JCM 14033 / SH-6) TaxID=797210 RepID=F8D4I2_HALXS|nr:transcriptional regulator [Halopiger xanaduensis]AEH36310.1 hypothetical protein Halxa_1678 [Halopiger xanaduensis SH-6]